MEYRCGELTDSPSAVSAATKQLSKLMQDMAMAKKREEAKAPKTMKGAWEDGFGWVFEMWA